MQLRVIARRAGDGSLTILGDVAQANRRGGLSQLGRRCAVSARGDEATVEELRHAYRVPARSWMWRCRCSPDRARHRAADLLPHRRRAAALQARERRSSSQTALREGASRMLEGLVAVILAEELAGEFDERRPFDGVPVLTPRQAKGLEFDHVVVVEPARDRRARAGPARALRRADATDEDARRRVFPPASAGARFIALPRARMDFPTGRGSARRRRGAPRARRARRRRARRS